MSLYALKNSFRGKAQPFFRKVGYKRLCKFGLFDLDSKLEKYLDFEQGFFVEAGANNGLLQSNTYYLEAIKGWTGLLIEPIPHLFQACKKNRPDCTSVHAALVRKEYGLSSVTLAQAGLMSAVSTPDQDYYLDKHHIDLGIRIQQLRCVPEVTVPAKTLDELLFEIGSPHIDFMSLDVEGYESFALDGLDLKKNGPDWLLVEVRPDGKVNDLLKDEYDLVENLIENDRYTDSLFKKKG